jgi:hypothetical protein
LFAVHGAPLLAGAICLAAALLALRFEVDYLLIGSDSYPIAASSRVEGLADLWSLVSDELMRGAFPHGHMYRPTFSLTVAADLMIWGDRSFGFHVSTALLFAVAGFAVFALARRLAPAARWAPWFTLAAYLTHPIHAKVLPVMSRRPEPLIVALICATLVVSLRGPGRSRALHWCLLALLAALAVGAKVTAAMLLPLVFTAQLLSGPRAGSILGAARACVAPLVGTLIGLIARLLVLGGIGGYFRQRETGIVEALGAVAWQVFRPITAPPGTEIVPVIVLGAAVALALALGVARLRRGAPIARPGVFEPLSALGAVWFVLGILVAQTGAGRAFAWYGALPLVGWTLAFGAVVETLIGASTGSSRRVAIPSALAAALATVALVWFALGSPLVREHKFWSRESARLERYLSAVRESVEAAPPGAAIGAPSMPRRGPLQPERADLPLVRPYTLQGWADLSLREHPVQVVFNGRAVRRTHSHRAPPGERLLVVDMEPN